ncbi:putative ROP-interactive CRIB motif-containing protein 6 [Hibiscus syriacus]|uniref:ROP-interactive CRIB motif-containing protein 6 n=1 Tax=Hibiscus syriacus TaxID=106335 RepID=A0A6A2ZKG8_HIBSY|nr:putative ROP-interactive CRIB motif-containing protein 6 [Hibiscus syriacus]
MPKYGSVEISSSSSGPVRRVMSNANFSVELFDGSGHFGMWQGEVEQKYGYKNETSASKMWKALEEKFLKKSSQNRLHMKKRLFRFDYQPGTSMNEHITAFNELVEDLLGMDETFKDEDLALMLLSSLPDEFEHLETTLLHGKDNVTLKDVTDALYSYELRKKTKNESKYEAAEAMVARGRSKSQTPKWRGRSKSKSRLGKNECAFCHEKGHWKKDCPKLKKKGKAAPDACVAEHDAHDSDISLAASSTTFHSDEWILDSGCTYHMSPNREWFFDLVELNAGVVYMGNDNACKTVGIGSIRLKNQDRSTRVLTDVRYVPSLKKNLISLGALESKGSVVTMRDGVLKVTYGALVMMKGIKKNNLYYYQGSTIIGAVAAASGGDDLDATQLWHMRLGHAGEKSLQIMAKKGLLKGAKACKLNFCEHCVLGKQKRVKFGTTIHNTKGIVDYIHSDVWGPSKTSSLGGNHYFVTFVDDFSRRVWVYLMKSKDEVLQIFLKWKNMIENQTGRKIKRLRTNNGGEYKSDPFFYVCHEYGIVRHFTVRHTPQQNGVAERMNRTLLEKVQSIGGKTLLELDPRAKKALFMGITHGVKGFRLWCLDTKKIICSRDVTFDESALVKKVTSEAVQTSSTPQQVEHTPKQVEFQQMMIPEVDAADSSTPIEESEDEEVQIQEPLETPETLAVTRPRREIRRPARFVDMVAYALPVVDDDIPITYQEAIQSLESDKWKSAMDEEMQSLQKNDTWKLAQLPKGKRAIGCKWVFVKKDGSHNKKDVRYKARLVAKGYAQKEGIDYNEVFSPVVKHSSSRILLALVAQLNLELAQLDVCKLNKSLYGLKQSPRQWYKRFDSFMRRQKYTRSKYDHCVYLQKLKDGSFIYLLFYVDDMLIASKSQKEIDKLKAQLNQEFEMKDLGEAKKILGMEISRDRQRGKLCLTQKQYLRKVLQCFSMNENTKHVSIPLASHLKLSSQLSPKTNEERVYMAKVPYANAVGSLMYAMVCTRIDISQAVGVVSRYMHNPGEGHWQAVKWFLRYLQQTMDVGLVFEQDEALGQCMVGYVDSDYAGDLDKRRSTIGYLFTLAKAPVSWKSTLQSTVALSTTEAEYMAVSEASAIHLAKNQVYHSRTKHIDVRYHFVREIFEEGKILLQKIATSENPADMMTKVTPKHTQTHVFAPEIPTTFGSFLEELVFINNPAFVGPLSGIIRNFTRLRRLVLTGNGVYENIPDGIGELVTLEEITLSRNKLSGQVSAGLSKLKKLKVLDFSANDFHGNVPCAVGNLTQLLKLDLSSNGFSGKIPESLGNLQDLDFLDLSFNSFGNFGVPLFLAEMPRLKDVYLSGNLLGGEIPEIWEKLGSILRIGFSGKVPEEFGCLEFVSELNLENNNLSGRVPFSAKIGEKLRLKGNPELCVDAKLSHGKSIGSSSRVLKKCSKPDIPNAVILNGGSNTGLLASPFHVMLLFWGLLIVLV